MPWVRIDEQFYDHPKWADAPGDSIALWLAAMAWCNRNDSLNGFIPTVKLNGLVNVRNTRRTTADLVTRRALHPENVDGIAGYLIHDYPEYQQPEKVRAIAAKRSAAGKKGATNRWAERHRAEEYAEAPPPPDHQADEMAKAIATGVANAIANGWPDTDYRVPELVTSSSSLSLVRSGPADDDDFRRVVKLCVDARMRGRSGVRDQRAYRSEVARDLRAEDGELIRRMLGDGTGPEAVARFVLGHGFEAQAERDKPDVPWCDETCATCGGDAWVDTGAGLAPCPGRTARAS